MLRVIVGVGVETIVRTWRAFQDEAGWGEILRLLRLLYHEAVAAGDNLVPL